MIKYISIIFCFLFFIVNGCIYQDHKEESKIESNKIDSPDFVDNTIDSIFFKKLKKFFFQEIGYELEGDFYTESKNIEDFDYLLIVSLPNKIESPNISKSNSIKELFLSRYNLIDIPYIDCGKDIENVKKIELENKEKGYHTLYFQNFLNSNTFLNNALISLSKEDICHIVFHELMHNYIRQKKIRMPRNYEEALCEVIGNYFALKFAENNNEIDTSLVKSQILTTEKIYQCINNYTFLINSCFGNVDSLNNECQKEINTILENVNSFPKERFGDNVNNAFLLLHNMYSKNYFILKELYFKQTSIKKFIDKIPKSNSSDAFLEIPSNALLQSVRNL